MSRFYDALREASRTPATPPIKPEEAESDVLGLLYGSVSSIPQAAVTEPEASELRPEQDSELKPESLYQDLPESVKAQLNGSASHAPVSQNMPLEPQVTASVLHDDMVAQNSAVQQEAGNAVPAS